MKLSQVILRTFLVTHGVLGLFNSANANPSHTLLNENARGEGRTSANLSGQKITFPVSCSGEKNDSITFSVDLEKKRIIVKKDGFIRFEITCEKNTNGQTGDEQLICERPSADGISKVELKVSSESGKYEATGSGTSLTGEFNTPWKTCSSK